MAMAPAASHEVHEMPCQSMSRSAGGPATSKAAAGDSDSTSSGEHFFFSFLVFFLFLSLFDVAFRNAALLLLLLFLLLVLLLCVFGSSRGLSYYKSFREAGAELFEVGGREDCKPLDDTPLVVVATEQKLQDTIRAIKDTYNAELFKVRGRDDYKTLDDTPLVVVATEQKLQDTIRTIKDTCTRIAMDVEYHHEQKTSLVQISTRDNDYILDPLAPGVGENMHKLNVITADPRILKVLHGAENDFLWLKQDFNLNLVSVFDTQQAMSFVKKVHLKHAAVRDDTGYASTVSVFCGVKLDKKLQTADWSIRPLTEEMLEYARCDTHYLLFCYDSLRNMLLCMRDTTFDLADARGEDGLRATLEGREAVEAVAWSSTAESARLRIAVWDAQQARRQRLRQQAHQQAYWAASTRGGS